MPASTRRATTEDSTRRRLLILTFVFVGVLVTILVRLWSMQLIHGAEYVAQSTANRTSELTTIAPRGRILDRNGAVLVDNRATTAVVADNTVRNDKATLQRLSNILGVPQSVIVMRMENSQEAQLAPKVISADASEEAVAYIAEHKDLFRGVTLEPRTVRTYPNGNLAAHVLGYTGGISDEELKEKSFINYDPGDIVGKSGAEAQFESILQGDRGVKKVEVDASGRIMSTFDTIDPVPGHDVKLTIDTATQKVAEQALLDGIESAHRQKYANANAGAVVALNVKTGEVLAMASYPTYNPSTFINGIDEGTWDELTSKEANAPLTNRAIASGYAPASTFKAFVGLASLQEGMATSGSSYHCAGTWEEMGKEWAKKCWNLSGHGNIGFQSAIAQSCDIAFYEMGYKFYNAKSEALQQYIRTWGYGTKTGIDLPTEKAGRIPDAEWKKEFNENYPEYQKWLPGDTANLSIGQGDVLVTPLQIATSYAGIANNGTLMKPHVFKEALDDDGNPIITQEAEPYENQPQVSPENLKTIQEGLRMVITDGTAKASFRGFDVATAGKTGTAQVANKDDYALYAGFAPYDDPQYCVVAVIEQGGGGAVATATAREVLAQLLGIQSSFFETEIDHSR